MEPHETNRLLLLNGKISILNWPSGAPRRNLLKDGTISKTNQFSQMIIYRHAISLLVHLVTFVTWRVMFVSNLDIGSL